MIETLALILSNIAKYIYTREDFVSGSTIYNEPLDRLGNKIILAAIFLGVHILVGLAAYGIYLAAQ